MIELDHLHLELSGTKLIEASAGTGKTYAIASLYLRLLVEQGLAPEQILVVTYTEAATMELRGRIRDRIRAALAVFDGGATDDAFLSGLAANVNGKGPGVKSARDRLERALNAFDTASIHTIHAFCLRALQENAFESGSLYDTKLMTSQTELLQEVVDDFWRIRFFTDDAPLLRQALLKKFSPETFMDFLKGLMISPNLEIRPSFGAEELAAVSTRCESLSEQARKIWQEKNGEIRALIESDKGLKRSEGNYRADLLPALFSEMDVWVAGKDAFALFPGFDKFTASGVVKRTKPTGKAPTHPFFDLCGELADSVDERFLALKWELVAFCQRRLPELKKKRNIRFFDDLLNDLYEAIQGERGEALTRSLREKYRAALIDEFQDTDPVQYDIFRSIYAAEQSPLFLIGDPKQAIYSFRGADIFAYREAALDVSKESAASCSQSAASCSQNAFTLTGNWRSAPKLLDAFNAVFDSARNPFVYEWIAYHRVRSGRGEARTDIPVFEQDAPLQLWTLPPGGDGKPLTVSRAREIIPAAVAGEIVRLLKEGAENGTRIDGHPLFPGDIAVLVRNRWQAVAVQKALRESRIPSVVRSDMSVFASGEARELFTLLAALASPGSEAKIRAALVSDILGMTGDDIALLLEDEKGWDAWVGMFRDWHQIWDGRGFMVMAQSLLSSQKVRGRLLRFSDGERRLTNLLHCLELIHRQEHEQKPGIEGLVAWFAERLSAQDESEECQIRLETDEKAVRVATIHVSKGLEYPIVFCPFMWEGVKDDGEVAAFHDGFRRVKDFGSPAFHDAQTVARRESLAESLRLLYVAMTRAKYRCYLTAGKVAGSSRGKSRPENSALAWLFHASEETRAAAAVAGELVGESEASCSQSEASCSQISLLSAEKMQEQLVSIQERANGTISVAMLPEGAPPFYAAPGGGDGALAARRFSGTVVSDWRVTSFTAFAAHESAAHELPDRDGDRAPEAASGEGVGEKTIFAFPRGAQAGIFFHEIFEELDFAGATAEAVNRLVGSKLEKYGYEKEWVAPLGGAIGDVIHTPLAAREGTFTLSDIRPGAWTTEMEFYFPLKWITSGLMGECLKRWDSRFDVADISRVAAALDFRPVRGMVRGFMDMVFEYAGKYYLVDWKSNHLGFRVEDYGPEALRTAMERNLYPLQYLIYTVALNRHLTRRVRGYDYASSFGGVIYAFIRGASAKKGEIYGFFRDVPPAGMIADLTGALMEEDKRSAHEEGRP